MRLQLRDFMIGAVHSYQLMKAHPNPKPNPNLTPTPNPTLNTLPLTPYP